MDAIKQLKDLLNDSEKALNYNKVTTLLTKFDPERDLDYTEKTSLLEATIERKDLKLLKILLENNVNVQPETRVHHPMHTLLKKVKSDKHKEMNIKLFKELLKHTNYKKYSDDYFSEDNVLHAVVFNTKLTKIILDNTDIDPNTKNKKGKAPIHTAIRNTNFKAFKLLLKITDYHTLNNDGDAPADSKDNTLLHYVIEHTDTPKFAKTLLEETKLDPNTKNSEGKAPIHLAIENNNYKFVQLLLKYTDHNILDKEGNNLLHYVTEHAYKPKFADTLLKETKLDPNTKNSKDKAPIHLAIESNNYKLIQLLLKHTDHNILDEEGNNLLHYVTKHADEPKIAKIILKETKLDPNEKNNDKAPIHEAITKDKLQITKELLKVIDHNILDDNNNTLIHFSVLKNKQMIVKTIIKETEIDQNAINNDNMTAFEMARKNKQEKSDFVIASELLTDTEYWKLSQDKKSVTYIRRSKENKTELTTIFNKSIGLAEIYNKEAISQKNISNRVVTFKELGKETVNKAEKQLQQLKKLAPHKTV
ncbi:MAG: hypothetical protein GY793_02015 [Proteobacteria bacterium]|nr:hypothetical protein [Pseudomonadota bacterium]